MGNFHRARDISWWKSMGGFWWDPHGIPHGKNPPKFSRLLTVGKLDVTSVALPTVRECVACSHFFESHNSHENMLKALHGKKWHLMGKYGNDPQLSLAMVPLNYDHMIEICNYVQPISQANRGVCPVPLYHVFLKGRKLPQHELPTSDSPTQSSNQFTCI